LEKPKFEFQKLELPKQLNYRHQSTEDKTENATKTVGTKPKPSSYGYLPLFTVICLTTGYYVHNSTNWLQLINAEILPKTLILAHNQKKNDMIQAIISDSTKQVSHEKVDRHPPVYFNYYDSIIFLNDVKGCKIVVSKGYDDYIKKDKIIVKSEEGYYYNIFCTDLYSNYAVGDTIP
jgi:hypothetical protein